MNNTRLFCELLLIGACLIAAGCSKTEEVQAEAPAPVQVTAVTQGTVSRVVSADGVLYAQNQAGVNAKIQAPVQKFYVNRSDHVKEGQLLATLENRDLTAQLAEAKGALDQAESNLRATQGASVPEAVVKAQTDVDAFSQAAEAAKKVLASREQLLKEGALARRQVDEAQVAYVQAHSNLIAAQEHLRALQSVSKEEQIKVAAAQVESARSHYQSLQASLSYSQILSPISGVVADRPLYAGEIAVPGTPLLTIMDISRVVARVNIPANQAPAVRLGQAAEITQVDSGQQARGKVIVVSPATDPNSTTVQVWVQAENPGEQFKPGASVHVKVITETFKNAMLVPSAAILPGEEGGTSVLQITPDSTAHRRTVQLGVRDGDRVQIVSGAVQPGDSVVIVGGLGVDDKAKVRVIEQAEPTDEDEEAGPEPDATKGRKEAKKEEAKPKGK